MTKFTAEEARKLAGPSLSDHVNEALDLIRLAAVDKRRVVGLRSNFWTRGGYNGTEECKAACKELEALGFKVSFFYEELQFVNMYTKVEW